MFITLHRFILSMNALTSNQYIHSIMKRTWLLPFSISFALLAISCCWLSCAKLKTLTLQKTYSDITFTIPAPVVAGNLTTEAQINTDLTQLAKDYNFDISAIESAKVKSITLQMEDTTLPPYTFAIVDQIDASFFADNITFTQIGNDDAIHTSPTQVDFTISGPDVAQYLKSNLFKVRMSLNTNTAITHDLPMRAKICFEFTVKPFK
ncbi:MAG: hypothetical protein RIQ62_673 [Bacteroidota bacterium]|jgi:hypothetical protein